MSISDIWRTEAAQDPLAMALDVLSMIAGMKDCTEAAALASSHLPALHAAIEAQANIVPTLYVRQADLDNSSVRQAVTGSKYKDGSLCIPLYTSLQHAVSSGAASRATIKQNQMVAPKEGAQNSPLEKLAAFPLETTGHDNADDATQITGFGSWSLLVGDVRRARQALNDPGVLLPLGWTAYPDDPTDEMLRVMLAVSMPASFREYLRHPAEGPKSRERTEKMIDEARAQYKALKTVAPAMPVQFSPSGKEPSCDAKSGLVLNGKFVPFTDASPFAWHNGLTDEFTRDPETGFIWGLNKYDVSYLFRVPAEDNGD